MPCLALQIAPSSSRSRWICETHWIQTELEVFSTLAPVCWAHLAAVFETAPGLATAYIDGEIAGKTAMTKNVILQPGPNLDRQLHRDGRPESNVALSGNK